MIPSGSGGNCACAQGTNSATDATKRDLILRMCGLKVWRRMEIRWFERSQHTYLSPRSDAHFDSIEKHRKCLALTGPSFCATLIVQFARFYRESFVGQAAAITFQAGTKRGFAVLACCPADGAEVGKDAAGCSSIPR